MLLTGITLGAMYCLVALGYTLVYGIIELINFAHGDVFMWGTMFAVTIVRRPDSAWTAASRARHVRWACSRRAGRRDGLSAASCNVVIERLAYRPLRNAPRLAPLITAIGMLVHPAERWPLLVYGPASRSPRPAARSTSGSSTIGTVGYRSKILLVVLITIPLLLALRLPGAQHAPGQGHAGHRPGHATPPA